MIALGLSLLMLVLIARKLRRGARRARAILPATILQTGFESAWRTPGRRRQSRGF